MRTNRFITAAVNKLVLIKKTILVQKTTTYGWSKSQKGGPENISKSFWPPTLPIAQQTNSKFYYTWCEIWFLTENNCAFVSCRKYYRPLFRTQLVKRTQNTFALRSWVRKIKNMGLNFRHLWMVKRPALQAKLLPLQIIKLHEIKIIQILFSRTEVASAI